jgi:hypothetical protein
LQAAHASTHASVIAIRLQQLTDDRQATGDLDAAKYVYQNAAYWFGRAKEPKHAAVMLHGRAVVTEQKADSFDQGI